MSHLRLVAGTDVTGRTRKKAAVRSKRLVKAEVDTKTLELQARTAIRKLKPGIEGLTVKEMLDEINHNRAGEAMSLADALRRNGELGRALRSVGLNPSPALPEQALDVYVYGVVLDSDTLLKTFPALQPYTQVLDGLTL
ncbi:hypothetical protein ACQVRX_01560 [Ralstonia pseudosolanacearum]